MELVFLFKPIVDMLYQLQFLDYLLVFIIIVGLVYNFKLESFSGIDICIIVLAVFFLFSFLRNPQGYAQFLKIESSFLLYFLGRCMFREGNTYIRMIRWGFLPVLFLTAVSFFTGLGFKMWGNYNTFTGFYFFKTDLALAMTQCLIVFIFNHRLTMAERIVILLCIFFVFISNARAYYFINIFVLYFYYLFKKENPGNLFFKRTRLGLKTAFVIFSSLVLLLIVLNAIEPFLGGKLLLFHLDSVADIYSGSNMQGRNIVWADIWKIFISSSPISQFYGIDLCSDVSSLGFNSHNLYLKILFSTGYLGLFVFSLFLYYIIVCLNQLRDRKLYFISTSLMLTCLLGGFSYISIESTQSTWLPMFFLGVSCSKVNKRIDLIRQFSRAR